MLIEFIHGPYDGRKVQCDDWIQVIRIPLVKGEGNRPHSSAVSISIEGTQPPTGTYHRDWENPCHFQWEGED